MGYWLLAVDDIFVFLGNLIFLEKKNPLHSTLYTLSDIPVVAKETIRMRSSPCSTLNLRERNLPQY